jgi:glycosyltransferase involved in cell wall biosynthesis
MNYLKSEGGLRTKGHYKQNTTDNPLYTIITVVYNGKNFIENTIKSILSQSYSNIEYIIIDGASFDGTIDILKSYGSYIDYWVSEPDSGIYDAMNKGITLSLGEYIGFVNADDILYKESISISCNAFKKYPDISFTYGSVDLIDKNTDIIGHSAPLSHELISKRIFKEMPFPHMSLYVCRQVYEKIGLFDLRFKLSADFDFIIRLYKNNFSGKNLNTAIGAFRIGGRSGGIKTFLESRKVLSKHNTSIIMREKYFLSSLAKYTLCRLLPISAISFIKTMRRSKHTFYKKPS